VSGTGPHPTTAEEHLGDRLAAFVDGELADDARDRVLSHLATCSGCKSAADDQRLTKNAISASAPPAISAGLLARLQGLPGLTGSDDDNGPGQFDPPDELVEGPTLGGERLDGSVFGKRGADFGLPVLTPLSRGFRIHEAERPVTPGSSGASRASGSSGSSGSASRGRRFAFAAAGAFSMAALALGGALPLDAPADPVTDDPGSAVTPLGAESSSVADVRPQSGNGAYSPRSPGFTPVSVARPLILPDDRPLVANGSSGSFPALASDAPLSASASPVAPSAPPSPAPSAAGTQPAAQASPSAPLPVNSLLSLLGNSPVNP
jgi:hypothetical protein